jgi:hypothetical protein
VKSLEQHRLFLGQVGELVGIFGAVVELESTGPGDCLGQVLQVGGVRQGRAFEDQAMGLVPEGDLSQDPLLED